MPPLTPRLIRAKVTLPPLPDPFFPRPRLNQILADAVSLRLMVVTAAAGYGKTTAVLSYCHAFAGQVAWYALDAEDNNPAQFGHYLVEALHAALGNISEKTRMIAAGAQTVSLRAVISELLHELDHCTSPMLLVLDDFHIVDHPDILAAVRLLVQHGPRALTIMVLGRAKPSIGMGGLLASRKAAIINEKDLAFDSTESRALLAMFGCTQMDDSALFQRVGGWAAGLQLLALSQVSTRAVSPLDVAADAIEDYLAEEILHTLSAEMQKFVLNTSILDRFTRVMATQLTGTEASPQIQYLLENNLFLIPTDAHHQWFRYHPVFSGFLRHQLKTQFESEYRRLHAGAAQLWMELGYFDQALIHSILAKDKTQTLTLLDQIAPQLYDSYQLLVLRRSFLGLLDEEILPYPNACMIYLRVLLDSDPEGFDRLLPRVERDYARIENTRWTGLLALVKAQRAFQKADAVRGSALAKQALEELAPSDYRMRVIATNLCAESAMSAGDLAQAVDLWQTSEREAKMHGLVQEAIWSLHQQASLRFSQGDWYGAEALQTKAIGYGEQQALISTHSMWCVYRARAEMLRDAFQLEKSEAFCEKAYRVVQHWRSDGTFHVNTIMASIRLMQNDITHAAHYLQLNAAKLATESYHPYALVHNDAVQLYLWASTRDLTAIAGWLQHQNLPQTGVNVIDQCVRRNVARAQGLLGRTETAIELLLQSNQQADKHGLLVDVFRNTLLLSACYENHGHHEKATQALMAVLPLIVERNGVGMLWESRDGLEPVLHRLLSSRMILEATVERFVRRVLDLWVVARPSRHDQSQSTDGARKLPLTAKEYKLLWLLEQGHAIDRAADIMCLSYGTAKNYLSKIYRKLGVSDREQAIIRLREASLS